MRRRMRRSMRRLRLRRRRKRSRKRTQRLQRRQASRLQRRHSENRRLLLSRGEHLHRMGWAFACGTMGTPSSRMCCQRRALKGAPPRGHRQGGTARLRPAVRSSVGCSAAAHYRGGGGAPSPHEGQRHEGCTRALDAHRRAMSSVSSRPGGSSVSGHVAHGPWERRREREPRDASFVQCEMDAARYRVCEIVR